MTVDSKAAVERAMKIEEVILRVVVHRYLRGGTLPGKLTLL